MKFYIRSTYTNILVSSYIHATLITPRTYIFYFMRQNYGHLYRNSKYVEHRSSIGVDQWFIMGKTHMQSTLLALSHTHQTSRFLFADSPSFASAHQHTQTTHSHLTSMHINTLSSQHLTANHTTNHPSRIHPY